VVNSSEGKGLSKSDLLLEFWNYRCFFLQRIRKWKCSAEAAEDFFQEACIKFMTSKAVFPHSQAGTRYFCRILQNLIFEHAKRSTWLEYRESLPEIVCEPQEGWRQAEPTASPSMFRSRPEGLGYWIWAGL
jgi:DNA-directed RNA polymerase specialized sigma24 family protein